MNTDLLGVTRRLLVNSEKPMEEIAKGAKCSVRWLFMLKKGEVPNPTLRKLSGLHAFLSGGRARSSSRRADA